MKKVIALLLSIMIVFSLFACTATKNPGETELGPEVIEKKDYSQYAGIVIDTKTWYDEFMALPIANENMTEQELRQLCVDAFRLNMTIPWTPNKQIVYTYELLDRYKDVSLPIGMAYSGLCYATGIKDATCGNAWKMLPYYDVQTGVLDVEAIGDANILNIISSACSYGAQQGWNRVSNSHGLTAMGSYCKEKSNIVPVGTYTYEPYMYNYKFSSRTASNEIIAANGDKVMYESLAQMKMADGVYSSSAWHVMMCSQDPVVVRFPDGSVNPLESYVYVHEQGGAHPETQQSNGKMLRPLGTIDNKYTFEKLLSSGYIPFTLKEFTGEDPVEPGKAWVGTETAPMENGEDITADSLSNKKLCANYNLCNIKVEVKAPDGTVLVSYYPQFMTAPQTFSVSLMGYLQTERVQPYANGKNTIHFYAQLSNGELLEAFNTLLKMD